MLSVGLRMMAASSDAAVHVSSKISNAVAGRLTNPLPEPVAAGDSPTTSGDELDVKIAYVTDVEGNLDPKLVRASFPARRGTRSPAPRLAA